MPFYNASTRAKAKNAAALKPKLTAPSQADTKLDTTTQADALPSSPAEDVRPPPPSPPPTPAQAVADEEATRSLSPRPLSPLLKDLKDLRAYEHERQRAKRAGEWALKRARKSDFGTGPVHVVAASENRKGRTSKKGALQSGGERTGSGGGIGIGREDVDVEFVVGGRLAGAVAEDLNLGSPRKPEPLGLALALVAPTRADLSVSLSDLIVPPKPKPKSKSKTKSKSKLGKFGSLASRKKSSQGPEDTFSYTDACTDEEDGDEEEFELVPALRAVIALDEVDPRGRRDMEVDEPWECVGGEEEEEKKKSGLSYADVLSGVHLD